MKLFYLPFFLLLISFITISFTACDEPETTPDFPGSELGIFPSAIEIEWEVLTNFAPENQFTAKITIHNRGDDLLPPSGWQLYFNSIRLLENDSFLPYFEAEHINGDFFSLKPTDVFDGLPSGESLEVEYIAAAFSIKRSDAPQGFYFAFDDGRIETVQTVDVVAFERDEQVNRSPADRVPVPDAGIIFEANTGMEVLDGSEVGKIIPTPAHIEYHEGEFDFTGGTTIYHHALFTNEAEWLANHLHMLFDVPASTDIGSPDGTGPSVYLNMLPSVEADDEAYTMEISEGLVEISASSPPGIFYGIQSLLALLSNRDSEAVRVPSMAIEDHPAFGYRGMHLDVSRNFQSVDSVKRLLDIMAMYKLNKFHFHLTDDEGWRLDIETFPELVQIGGRRGHTTDENDHLIPAYGSGPDPTPGRSMGSGWYSQSEYIELLQYANERHIEVIPEIDLPGHARAAIVAMKARSERLQSSGAAEDADYYRLDEPEDRSEYLSIQNFNDNVVNVCLESTYRFIEVVIDEIVDMHRVANAPLTSIHMGGDEVPRGVWERSPACNELMEAEGIDNHRDLQSYFFHRVNTKLRSRGLTMAGWEEVVFSEDPESGEHIANPDFAGSVHPHVWSNIWGGGTENYAYLLANMGYNVIMSHASNFYFDLAYDKHWEEPGFYWANMFDSKEPFSFIPFDLYRNAIRDSYGNPIAEDHFADEVLLAPHARENILGIQGQLWTETVNVEGRMEYMVLPRLLALAERAWTGNPEWAEAENREEMLSLRDTAWNEFANRIGQFELNRLDSLFPAINYRLPVPGAEMENGVLQAVSPLPGLIIRYSLDDDELTADSQMYKGPVEIDGAEKVNVAVFNNEGRHGRVINISVN